MPAATDMLIKQPQLKLKDCALVLDTLIRAALFGGKFKLRVFKICEDIFFTIKYLFLIIIIKY